MSHISSTLYSSPSLPLMADNKIHKRNNVVVGKLLLLLTTMETILFLFCFFFFPSLLSFYSLSFLSSSKPSLSQWPLFSKPQSIGLAFVMCHQVVETLTHHHCIVKIKHYMKEKTFAHFLPRVFSTMTSMPCKFRLFPSRGA